MTQYPSRAVDITTSNVDETRAVGRRLAAMLRPGDVVALVGKLGAGKTAFAGGVADGLGVEEEVTSPSFLLVKRYESGFMPLVHCDVYRLRSIGEFNDLDVVDDAGDGVLLIEWADAVSGALPPDRLVVKFDVDGDSQRTLRFHKSGAWVDRPLNEVAT